ncbi:MAG: phage terminase large subunit [Alphaproteobacteria bacterium]|nr:phage terminase large subunit [Alphaproteobacteria bacterium]
MSTKLWRPQLIKPKRKNLIRPSLIRPQSPNDRPSPSLSQKMRTIYRNDLFAFTWRAFGELYPDKQFFPNWHLFVIAAKLQAVMRGEITRLAICLPPRSLKSFMASIAFPAWVLGHHPSRELLCVSYAQDLSEKLAWDMRRLMQMPFYLETFDTRLSSDRGAISEFTTTAGGVRLSSSITGGVTGRGGDINIVDDPHKADDVFSEARLAVPRNFYDNTLYSRLNDKVRGAMVMIGQRLHENDLIGHALRQEQWELVSFPAIATQDEEHRVLTPYGPRTFRRAKGELLHAEREPLSVLERQRKAMGQASFQAQYQQDPTPAAGNWVQPKWFQRYAPATKPRQFDSIALSVDSANKASETSDYTVLTVWGISGEHYYLLHLVRERVEFHDLVTLVEMVATTYKVDTILIEDRASGTQLIQELKRKGRWNVIECQPVGDKAMRFGPQAHLFRLGHVFVPADAPWVDEYIRELCAFPNTHYADQVDSTSQFLAWVREPGTSSARGWIEYFRGRVEQNDAAQGFTVRLRAPEGVHEVTTRRGRYVQCRYMRVRGFSPAEAEDLIAKGWTKV